MLIKVCCHVFRHLYLGDFDSSEYRGDLSPDVSGLTQLRHMTLRWCGVKKCPPELGLLTGLTHLALLAQRSDTLPKLSAELSRLTNLKSLGLSAKAMPAAYRHLLRT